MPIVSNSTITNQYVPDFKIEDLVNGQLLIYSSTQGAFVNSSSLGTLVDITADNIPNGTITLAHLDTANTGSVGQVLSYGAGGELTWISIGVGGAVSLSGLTDTGITIPATGEYLKFNGSIWVNDLINIDDLESVSITSLTAGQSLVFNGTNWINQAIDYNTLDNAPSIPTNNSFTFVGLSDTNNTPVINGYLLWDGAASEIIYSATIPAGSITGLATVATTGSYTDLINQPNLAQYAVASSLETVATSGSFYDLVDAPNVPANINDLLDVVITSPTSGQFLKYNGSNWVNSTVPYPVTLEDLSDVLYTGIASTKVLKFNGTNWVPDFVAWSEISGKPSTFTPSTHTHVAADITDLTAWVSANASLVNLTALGDTANSSVANGYLLWDGTGSEVIYSTTIPAASITGLAPVATVGTYASLSGTPTLATVATSGDYGDLLNLPTLVTNLNSLTDVIINAPASNNTLVYSGGSWSNAPLDYSWLVNAPTVPVDLDDLSDVVVTTPSAGQTLRYNGTNFVNVALAYSDLSGTPTSNSWTFTGLQQTNDTPVANGYLRWNGVGTEITYSTTISAASITGLADVATSGDYGDLFNLPTLFDGQYSSLTGIPSTFAPASHTHVVGDITGLSIPTDLDDLGDVVAPSPSSGQYLQFNGTNWVPYTLTLSSYSIDALGDVTITTPSSNQILKYNGTQWINSTVAWSEVTGKPSVFTPDVHSHVAADITDLSSWLTSNNALLSFTGLGDTNNTAVSNAYLQWNGTGTTIMYVSTIPASDITGLAAVATSGSYSSLSGTPTIPSTLDTLTDVVVPTPTSNQYLKWNGSQWVNDTISYSHITGGPTSSSWTFTGLQQTNDTPVANGYLRWNAGASQINYSATIPSTDITGLATVANTGAYSDLSGAPTIPVNNDFTFTGLSQTDNIIVPNAFLKWNAGGTSIEYTTTISVGNITGLASVATSGLYSSLSGTPTIPSVLDDFTDVDLTIAPTLNQYLKYDGANWVSATIAYSHLSGSPTIPVNNDFSLVGLSDTANSPTANGYLKWNAGGTSVEYTTSIPSSVITGLATVATTGAYSDLIAPPAIPTNNDFTFTGLQETNNTPVNNGFLRWNGSGTQINYSATIPYADITGLATVANTGAYSDLSGTPTSNSWTFTGLQQTNDTPVANGYLRWNAGATQINYSATISVSDITGLSNVATTGDYGDLINAPTLFDGQYSSLTGIPSSFTPSSHTHPWAQITGAPTIPSLIDDLTDVDLSIPPVNGQALIFDSGDLKWKAGGLVNFLNITGVDGTAVPNAYLRWNNAGNEIIYETNISAINVSGLAAVATSGDIGDLVNVDVTSLSDGDVLVYDLGTETWVSQAAPSLTLNIYSLDDLGDVVISTPSAGDFLRYNGTDWVDAKINYSEILGTPVNSNYTFVGLSDTSNSVLANGILRWNGSGTQINYTATLAASDITGLAPVATAGTYASLTGQPTIPTELDDLTDVIIGTPNSGDVLTYNGDEWISAPPVAASMDLEDLSNVNVVSPSADQVLAWSSLNGGEWVNYTLPITPVLATVATTGDFNDLLNQPTYSFEDLSNSYDTPLNNGFLRWNGSGTEIVYQATIAATDVTGLSNVATSGVWTDLTTPPTSADFYFTGLADVASPAIANRYLKWDGTEVTFATMSVDALTEITNLRPVATGGDLGDLDDVDLTGLLDGNFLVYDLGNNEWVPANSIQTTWQTITTNYNAVAGDALAVDTTLGTVTITLSATPSVNDSIRIVDYAGTFSLNECVVTSSAHDIHGSSRDYNIVRKGSSLELTFIDATEGWRITSGLGEETTWTTVSNANSPITVLTPIDEYFVDTTGGIVVFTLPASPEVGDRLKVCDLKGTFPLNKCSISRNGNLIMGLAENLEITSQNATIELTFYGGPVGWKITEGIGELSFKANDIYTDLDIYVETTLSTPYPGNDTTGTGTQTAPYATLRAALEAIEKSFIANDVFVNINIGEGVYTDTITQVIEHTYGHRIKIKGETPLYTAKNIVAKYGTPTINALEITLNDTTDISSGDFVKIVATAGTGNYELVNGVYEVQAVNSGPDRITVDLNYQGDVSDLIGLGLSSGTVTKQKTILKYDGCHGIQVLSGQLRSIENVTIVGNNTAGKHGIMAGHEYGSSNSNNTGGSVDLGTNVNVCTFGGYGLYATHGGHISADESTVTRNGYGIYAGYNAIVSAKQAVVANSINEGVRAEYCGLVDAGSIVVRGSGSYALAAVNRGAIKADSAVIDDANDLPAGGTIVYAKGMSTIFIPDLTGSSVTYSPTWNTTGNGNSFIGDA